MNISVVSNYEEMGNLAAEKIVKLIKSNRKAVLGLPTGSTPLGMYEKLINMHKKGGISFKDVITFNLDEYEGLDRDNPNSYHSFMRDNFFDHVDMNIANVNFPDAKCIDSYKACMEYEERIKNAGGIDLMVLGLGNNGHIGFNEPCEHFPGITHRVKLHKETIKANSRFFKNIDEVPKYAVTMGIRSIMHCRSIMLIANGKAKAGAIKKAIKEPVTPKVPASVLQLHQNVTVIIDYEAASLL